jgi:hypothetical protein
MRFAILLMLVARCFEQQALAEEGAAIIRILVSTTFGESAGKVQAVLTGIGPKEQFNQTGEEIRFDHIPFGLYELEVQAPGFYPHREQVGIYQKEIWYRIGLSVAILHSEKRPELWGTVTPFREYSKDIWVRLMSVYSGDLIENRVEGSGHFEVAGLYPGRYLLFVFDKDRLIDWRSVDFLGGQQRVDVVIKPTKQAVRRK